MKTFINKIIKFFVRGATAVSVMMSFQGCSDYLDIVPDNIATIDHAFVNANMAEKYLFTCYSYLPQVASQDQNAMMLCDEFWAPYPRVPNGFYNQAFEEIARGNQGVVSPVYNAWDGVNNAYPMFVAIRACNLFLEKIGNVPQEGFKPVQLDDNRFTTEKEQWISEVKFLKAYYHYWLLRMYGPIPLVRENLPISASVEEVQVKREPVDECFDYIVSLIDEAIVNLPLTVTKPSIETGRITKAVALAMKAKILVEAASPLFNGNKDFALFIDSETNKPFFNQTEDNNKWVKASQACNEAVQDALRAGFRLHEFTTSASDKISGQLIIQMNVRSALTEPNSTLNREPVWQDTRTSTYNLQKLSIPCIDPKYINNYGWWINMSPTLKMAELFYSENGVPIDQDDDWMRSGKYASRYLLRDITDEYRYNMQIGEQTVGLHFDREPRFYANLGFDRGHWYGNGKYDQEDQWTIKTRNGEAANISEGRHRSVTGYMPKKLVNYQGEYEDRDRGDYIVMEYAYPIIRLADLYLLYAEALNEAEGPSSEVYQWIDLVRERAGLEGVVDSWSKYAVDAHKNDPADKNKLRGIIQRERLIELSFEGHRYWDIRRWKKAKEVWHNQSVQGWDINEEDAAGFYRVKTLFVQKFNTRDYLWPIREDNLNVNPRLVQNPGW